MKGGGAFESEVGEGESRPFKEGWAFSKGGGWPLPSERGLLKM